MTEPQDCEFVVAMVAAGIPTSVAVVSKEWAEKEVADAEATVGV